MANLRKQVDRSPSQAEKEDVGVWCRVTKIQSRQVEAKGPVTRSTTNLCGKKVRLHLSESAHKRRECKCATSPLRCISI
ncbi:hypothetical protein CDAR_28491 [Caerostris darwini]|uniref:Uncharacterized protein n=1 Tax=Caerostris darwini TaxID=1538125 RepID=A0AAV4Q7R2_9ARAC|nr:hypothetical protein CDAR_28491 [Caerostris darwini]